MSSSPFGDDFMSEFNPEEGFTPDQNPMENFDAWKWNALLNHIFFLRITTNQRTNLEVLRHAAENSEDPKKREEAKKWLDKMHSETLEYFRNNVCIAVLVDGERMCNLNVKEKDSKDKIIEAIQHIPPVKDKIGERTIKRAVYSRLKSINLLLE